jgi:hypothetical protein
MVKTVLEWRVVELRGLRGEGRGYLSVVTHVNLKLHVTYLAHIPHCA